MNSKCIQKNCGQIKNALKIDEFSSIYHNIEFDSALMFRELLKEIKKRKKTVNKAVYNKEIKRVTKFVKKTEKIYKMGRKSVSKKTEKKYKALRKKLVECTSQC
tara:strand:- start:561 stop:872 length:312 start_codon:yes stop_codon:yes gene_type:complete